MPEVDLSTYVSTGPSHVNVPVIPGTQLLMYVNRESLMKSTYVNGTVSETAGPNNEPFPTGGGIHIGYSQYFTKETVGTDLNLWRFEAPFDGEFFFFTGQSILRWSNPTSSTTGGNLGSWNTHNTGNNTGYTTPGVTMTIGQYIYFNCANTTWSYDNQSTGGGGYIQIMYTEYVEPVVYYNLEYVSEGPISAGFTSTITTSSFDENGVYSGPSFLAWSRLIDVRAGGALAQAIFNGTDPISIKDLTVDGANDYEVIYKPPSDAEEPYAMSEWFEASYPDPDAGQDLVGEAGYKGWTDLGWDFTRDLKGNTLGITSYVYDISTATGTTFDDNIVQTVTKTAFESSVIFSGLTKYQTYFARVKATGDLQDISNISSNSTNPCESFSAVRTVNETTGNATITVTSEPNTTVFVSESITGDEFRGLVRPVADDQFNNLFVATGEGLPPTPTSDGSGKLVFDGGFPKFYSAGQHNKWQASYGASVASMFSSTTPGQWAYMYNCIRYCSAAKSTPTNKVLYINDSNYLYGVDTFRDGITGCAALLGKTTHDLADQTGPSNSAHQDYIQANAGASVANWYNYFVNFDCIVWMGTNMTTTNLPGNFLTALWDYINNGGGFFGITDHDSYQFQINQVVAPWGIQFTGNIDRTTNHSAYKVSNILNNASNIPDGYHPLFDNMSPDSYIRAGESEGKIIYNPSRALTSSYTTNNNGTVNITSHNNGTSLDVGETLVRTPFDCGEHFPDMLDRTPDENDPTLVCSTISTHTARWGHTGQCQFGYTNISPPWSAGQPEQMFTLPLNGLQGNMLNVTGFYLDDCAFLVPPYDTAAWGYGTHVSNHNITLPYKRCFMITNGTPSLMTGAIDGGGATYHYGGQTYTHGNAPASTVANALANLGVPVIAYNDISLNYLVRLGFVTSDGSSLAFRILHDGQGCGGIYMDVNIATC